MNLVYSVFFVTGLVLCVLGLLVWKKQMVFIIAGYDPRKVVNPAGLARWVGRNVFLMGAAVMVLALIGLAIHRIPAIIGSYMVVVLGGSHYHHRVRKVRKVSLHDWAAVEGL